MLPSYKVSPFFKLQRCNIILETSSLDIKYFFSTFETHNFSKDVGKCFQPTSVFKNLSSSRSLSLSSFNNLFSWSAVTQRFSRLAASSVHARFSARIALIFGKKRFKLLEFLSSKDPFYPCVCVMCPLYTDPSDQNQHSLPPPAL